MVLNEVEARSSSIGPLETKPRTLTVTRLAITPIKGLALHHPDAIELTDRGCVGDRLFYLVDDGGVLQSCTRNPGLFGLVATWDAFQRRLEVSRGTDLLLSQVVEPPPRAATVATDMWGTRTQDGFIVGGDWAELFSDVIGRPVRLVEADGLAYDVHPVTLLGTGSVARLAEEADQDIASDRFRMLVEFDGGEAHVEDTWTGRPLVLGGATLRAGGPVKRCAATTRNPHTGAVDLQTLRLITGYRGRQPSELGVGANFGIYADILEPGRVTVGDILQVLAPDGTATS